MDIMGRLKKDPLELMGGDLMQLLFLLGLVKDPGETPQYDRWRQQTRPSDTPEYDAWAESTRGQEAAPLPGLIPPPGDAPAAEVPTPAEPELSPPAPGPTYSPARLPARKPAPRALSSLSASADRAVPRARVSPNSARGGLSIAEALNRAVASGVRLPAEMTPAKAEAIARQFGFTGTYR